MESPSLLACFSIAWYLAKNTLVKNPQILHHPKRHAPDHNPQPKQDASDCNSTGWASAPPPPSSSLITRPPKTYKPYHQTSETLGKPSNPTRQDQAHHRNVTINILVHALNSVVSMSPLAQGSQWQSSKRRVKDPATKPSQPAILELGYQRPGKRGCESEADAEQEGVLTATGDRRAREQLPEHVAPTLPEEGPALGQPRLGHQNKHSLRPNVLQALQALLPQIPGRGEDGRKPFTRSTTHIICSRTTNE